MLRMLRIDRKRYADLYGPTTGDKIRLGDTDLFIEVEKDLNIYGEEAIFGGGKTIRDGLCQQAGANRPLDLVITSALILDAVTGIVKADIGIRDGQIVGIGKAGNPDVQDSDMTIGSCTEVISGEHMIATAGGIDTHIHWISPQQIWEAVSSGITTMIGGGTGPLTVPGRRHVLPDPGIFTECFRLPMRFPLIWASLVRATIRMRDL